MAHSQGVTGGDRAASLGRVLADEARLVRKASVRVRERWAIMEDIQEIRRQLRFLQGQWAAISRDGPAHKRANLVQILEAIDGRIAADEARLAELHQKFRNL